MIYIPKFLRGNFIVGPNGFCRHDVNTDRWFTIHWFPGHGLTITTSVSGNKTYKVRFRRLAKLMLKIKLRWS